MSEDTLERAQTLPRPQIRPRRQRTQSQSRPTPVPRPRSMIYSKSQTIVGGRKEEKEEIKLGGASPQAIQNQSIVGGRKEEIKLGDASPQAIQSTVGRRKVEKEEKKLGDASPQAIQSIVGGRKEDKEEIKLGVASPQAIQSTVGGRKEEKEEIKLGDVSQQTVQSIVGGRKEEKVGDASPQAIQSIMEGRKEVNEEKKLGDASPQAIQSTVGGRKEKKEEKKLGDASPQAIQTIVGGRKEEKEEIKLGDDESPQAIQESMRNERMILLHNVQGTKYNGGIKEYLPGSAPPPTVNVINGELLVGYYQEGQPYNYRLHRDPNTYLHCKADQVAALSPEAFLLLEAIKNRWDRLEAFRHKLDWGVSLKEGSRVSVTVPVNKPLVKHHATAVVRYKGKKGNNSGTFFGVEIIGQSHRAARVGTKDSDGTFQGQRYFTCDKGSGLFVTLGQISPTQHTNEAQNSKLKSAKDEHPRLQAKSANSDRAVEFRGERSPSQHVPWGDEDKSKQSGLSVKVKIARIELDEPMQGCSDGTKPDQSYPDIVMDKQDDDSSKTNELFYKQLSKELLAQKVKLIEKQHEDQALIEDMTVTIHNNSEEIKRKDEQIASLQQQLAHFIGSQPTSSDTESWKIPRAEIQRIPKKEIGHGAWGVVYSAKFRGKDVAIKIAHSAIFHEATVELLKREVTIMSQVQHPNLVRFIAAVWDDAVERKVDTPIIISELMGSNLRAAYRSVDLTKSLISIFRDVAYALHYLHCLHIIHRDISAPNVLLKISSNDFIQAKVSDFGSANEVQQSKTIGPGAAIYSAPEVFPSGGITAPGQPKLRQTTKVDVYSYGILLLEVIAKEMPSQETSYNMLQKIRRQWNEMHELILHCTKPSPSDRPTMADILSRLNSMPTIESSASVKRKYLWSSHSLF